MLATLAGCGDKSGPSDAVATAKCISGLYDVLKVPDGIRLNAIAVEVTRLSNGRKRVTGGVLREGRTAARSFNCIVAPDPSDKLRGLKIDALNVGGTTK